MLIRLSRVVVVVAGRTALWRYGIPRVEYLEVLLRAQQVSCDSTLEYFTYLEVPRMSFGEESTRTNQPNFPPQRFLTKAIIPARMSRQRQTKWWVELKMDPKTFWPNFSSVNTFPPKSQCDLLDLSVLWYNIIWVLGVIIYRPKGSNNWPKHPNSHSLLCNLLSVTPESLLDISINSALSRGLHWCADVLYDLAICFARHPVDPLLSSLHNKFIRGHWPLTISRPSTLALL